MTRMIKQCPVCNSSLEFEFNSIVLNKYKVDYHRCKKCELLQTEKPYWLDEAYTDPISILDTGLVDRNITLAKKLAVLLHFEFDDNFSFVDDAAGFGLLVRLMRDYGFNFYWNDKFCQNIFAKGFEISKNEKVDAVTAFEIIEHVYDPIEYIEQLMHKYHASTLIFSTCLYENKVPDKNWWYYSFETGQHISFYTKKTFDVLSKRLKLNFYTCNGFHILTRKKINFFKIKFFTGTAVTILFLWVRIARNSLTWEDHLSLVKRPQRFS